MDSTAHGCWLEIRRPGAPRLPQRWRFAARALPQSAAKSLRRFLQLALQCVHLLRNLFQLVLRERARFCKLMGLAISLANGCSDFYRDLRQLAFLSHRFSLSTNDSHPIHSAREP